MNSIIDETIATYSTKFNGYADFDECISCSDKYTSKCSILCDIFRIKQTIYQLNSSILTRDKYAGILYILNKKFRKYINKYSYIGMLSKDDIMWTEVLDEDIVCCVVNKKEWF